jgi:hypothetical protein
MIIREFFKTRKDGINLYKTYSNEGFLIKKEETNEKFVEAIDVEHATFTYIETDIKIPEKPILLSLRRPTKEA